MAADCNTKLTTIIIPAYNEEQNIEETINLIHHTGFNGRIVVVDDGSVDKTVEISERLVGKENVVKLGANRGKANAFFAGVREALKTNPEVVVTLDADMIRIPSGGLHELISSARQAERDRRPIMFVASNVKEGNKHIYLDNGSLKPNSERGLHPMNADISGIRSFSASALRVLIATRGLKKYVTGYQLEHFLNWFFERVGYRINVKSETSFAARPAYRKENMTDIKTAIAQMGQIMEFKRRERGVLERKARHVNFFRNQEHRRSRSV